MKGIIKNWCAERGFGFIRTEEGKDIFFHYSDCIIPDSDISVGLPVAFVVKNYDRNGETRYKAKTVMLSIE